jgi:tRNA nucleotidyltransferase (CCA-adding enzyme)
LAINIKKPYNERIDSAPFTNSIVSSYKVSLFSTFLVYVSPSGLCESCGDMVKLKLAKQILHTLESHGFQAYLVGGCVRDLLLARPIEDIDICTSAKPAEVMALFSKTVPTGIPHGTITVIEAGYAFEVTTFRSEEGYTDFRHPDKVHFVKSLRKDLSRRDFTINAMAMDKSGQLFDYFGGMRDLELRMIRTVGPAENRLSEDALRMLRAIRFSSQLGFAIDQDIFAAIKKQVKKIQKIAMERITEELCKLVLGEYVNLGLKMLTNSELYHYPPFNLIQRGVADAQQYDLSVLSELERWAMLLYPLSIPARKDFLSSVRLPNMFLKPLNRLLHLLDHYPTYTSVEHLNPVDAIHWSKEELLSLLNINQLRTTKRIDLKLPQKVEAYLSRLPLRHPRELAIDGHDLRRFFNRPPGPWIGDYLNHGVRAVMKGEVPNQKEAILAYLLEREEHE